MSGNEFRLAVIGDPVAHSRSPVMHTAALRAAGLSGSYGAVRVPGDDLAGWVRRQAHDYHGFNVTIPHKEAIVPLLDAVETAVGVEAVNTVRREEDGRLVGYNTDVSGFAATLALLGVDITRRDAVVFGAGGSARAVARALLDLGARITLVARNGPRAEALAQALGGTVYVLGSDDGRVGERTRGAALLVNTTPLGMSHLAEGTPLPAGVELGPEIAVIDLVYGGVTPLLRAARLGGCRTADGLEMLVQQGALSFALWTGRQADIGAMRSACRDAELVR